MLLPFTNKILPFEKYLTYKTRNKVRFVSEGGIDPERELIEKSLKLEIQTIILINVKVHWFFLVPQGILLGTIKRIFSLEIRYKNWILELLSIGGIAPERLLFENDLHNYVSRKRGLHILFGIDQTKTLLVPSHHFLFAPLNVTFWEIETYMESRFLRTIMEMGMVPLRWFIDRSLSKLHYGKYLENISNKWNCLQFL